MSAVTAQALRLTESGVVPDPIIRRGIRYLIRGRLQGLGGAGLDSDPADLSAFVDRMDVAPIAEVPQLANEQHYEVPAAFFNIVLGDWRKYSCCYWDTGVATLSDAEAAALKITAERAGIEDGMAVLDLGCGWGSFSFWIAEHFPDCRITAVSNSRSQRDFIVREAGRRGLTNIETVVADMNEFSTDRRYDRVVSIEMFEHMKNHRKLLGRIADWLEPGGAFLMHIFCHRATPYEFIDRGPGDWMSRHFFSGGIMPADRLPFCFQDALELRQHWRWDGTHYGRTATAWLRRMDGNKARIMPILADTYGAEYSDRWWMRWRLFFMSCAELFNFRNGQEWWVSHYLFEKRAPGESI